MKQRGFTLIEMVVAITLIGLLSMLMVPLLRAPMAAYIDAVRRADASAAMDVSMSKIGDDLAQALPGSVRVNAAGTMLEFVRVRATGRYSVGSAAPVCPAACSGGAARDALQFTPTVDNCFAAQGGLVASTAPVNNADFVVVNPQLAPLAVYNPAAASTNKSRLQSAAACVRVQAFAYPLAPAPAASSATPRPAMTGRPFYVVEGPVSYVCNPVAGTLTRVWGYPLGTVQPAVFPANAGTGVLATGVGACRFQVPLQSGATQLVSVWLRFSHASAGNVATESADAVRQFSVREAP